MQRSACSRALTASPRVDHPQLGTLFIRLTMIMMMMTVMMSLLMMLYIYLLSGTLFDIYCQTYSYFCPLCAYLKHRLLVEEDFDKGNEIAADFGLPGWPQSPIIRVAEARPNGAVHKQHIYCLHLSNIGKYGEMWEILLTMLGNYPFFINPERLWKMWPTIAYYSILYILLVCMPRWGGWYTCIIVLYIYVLFIY